ncbi:MAG: hypothetical protein BIFFINMI_01379 [Phycisphaerae bacterium]|nr:hypothetical protein [Phycisphaerae bacterium]
MPAGLERAANPMSQPISQPADGALTLPLRQAHPGIADALPARARGGERLAAAAVAGLAWSLLLIAWALTPRSAGLGTHEELGLPPCHIQQVSGYPCPSCGMTTAFAAFVHGHVAAALSAQVMGTALAAACLLAGLGAGLTAVSGLSLAPITARLFYGRTWFRVLLALLLGSWALKAALVWAGWQ